MKASIAVFLSGLVLGQTVQYVRTKTDDGNHCLRWPVSAGSRGSIHYVQSSTGDPALGSGVFDAVSRSAQTWETQLQACGNLDLLETGQHSSSRLVGYTQGGQNENLVLFRLQTCSPPSGDPCIAAGTCGNVHDCWDHGATVVALTTSSYIASSGEILDADIEINAASATPTIVDSPPCTGAVTTGCVANDVQNAVTHEFGHFMGLAHSPDPSSTMYASEPPGETSKRVLDSGSKQFICDAYPAGKASQDCSASDGGGGTSSSGCSTAGQPPPVAPGVLLLLLSLGIRRGRRRAA